MKLVFGYESALVWLRHHRSFGLGSPAPAQVVTLDDCACSQCEIGEFPLPTSLSNSDFLHVMAPSQRRQLKSSTHSCHVWTLTPPVGSFASISKNVYVATPELLFVQMATVFNFTELLLFGMELCGTYTRYNNESMDSIGCPAATSRKKLKSFATRAQGTRGAATALKALPWIIDNSNSPAESSLVLFLCLPPRLGGYGMPAPDMNPKNNLGKRTASLYGYDSMRCDLHWQKKHVVVEYNSSQEHLNPIKAADDAKRANILGYRDLQLITITPQMIRHPTEFDAQVKQLAKALGKRPARNAFLFSKERRELRLALFPWLKKNFNSF